jgi:glycogen(starch) synthase
MRIAFWTEFYAPLIGGSETIVRLLAEELVRQGHQALVITNSLPGAPDEEDLHGVRIRRLAITRAAEQRDLLALRRACVAITNLKRAFAPDVEHVHTTGPMLMVHQMVRRDVPSPVMVSFHLLNESLAPLVNANGSAAALFRQATWILTSTDIHRDTLQTLEPALVPKVRTVNYGLPVPALAPSPLPFEPATLLCFGRIIPEKGFDLAIRCLPLVRQRHPRTRMVIAGDGVERSRLENLVRELQLDDAVHFAGWVPPQDIPALVNSATMVLAPSRWQEPFGIIVLDGAIMARPVVTTEVGGFRRSAERGLIAALAEPENPAALADAVCALLADPDRARRSGQSARRVVLAEHSLPAFFQLHFELYQQCATVNALPP